MARPGVYRTLKPAVVSTSHFCIEIRPQIAVLQAISSDIIFLDTLDFPVYLLNASIVKNNNQEEMKMQNCKNKLAALISDECGSEVTEYALVLGLIIVAALGVIGHFGTKVVARWSSLNSSM